MTKHEGLRRAVLHMFVRVQPAMQPMARTWYCAVARCAVIVVVYMYVQLIYVPKRAKNYIFLHFLKQPVDGFQNEVPIAHYVVSRV